MIDIYSIENWILPREAFSWIYKNIPIGATILELGSGFGSIALGMNYDIYSIEHDKNWCEISNLVNYIYAPLADGFYNKNYLLNLPNKYDLFIIDGPTKASGGRSGILKNINLFNLKCHILLDDIHREEELYILKKLSLTLDRNFEIFECNNSKKFAII
jgi:hypothetical protein